MTNSKSFVGLIFIYLMHCKIVSINSRVKQIETELKAIAMPSVMT